LNKKGADDGATIAALTGAIEQLAQRSKNREQLQGIIATAKDLAQHWESKKRPLFEGYDNPLIQLLAALVVALRHYYDLLEPILRSSRDEFEKLRYANQETELSELANQLKNADDAKLTPETRALRDVLWPQLTTKQRKQRSEWKRRKCHRGDKGEIEWQFGNAFPILLSYVYGGPVIAAPTCLDGIFAGNEVSMATLEKVFGMDRHQLLENHRKRFNTELPGNGKGRARTV